MSTTALKLFAMLCMVLDHIATYIPSTPVWFHWIGRIAAPIFLFCMIWGFSYTHDRKMYMIRMYFCGLFMAGMDLVCNILVKEPYEPMTNNIFTTFLLIAFIIHILERYQADAKQGWKWIVCFLLFQVFAYMISMFALKNVEIAGIESIVGSAVPSVMFAEGSINFISMGVIMYFVKGDKKKMYAVFAIFAGLILLSTYGEAANISRLIEKEGCQWMMVFAIPFFGLYNGKKGRGLKYLFYAFYPVHILLLYGIGNLICISK